MKTQSVAALILAMAFGLCAAQTPETLRTSRVQTPNGVLEGVISADGKVRTFKGIPYAAPPVGPLRWRAPQSAASWAGIRKAVEYGPRCMQGRIYKDMVFRDDGPSENCLTLNLWMPATASADARLPVMVWIYGGGFAAGGTSEPRQDGGNLSKKGVLVVSLNYRLGIFGFFSHPELAKESGHNASGNYGLLDQVAALEWVHENIALFGGDSRNVTIFGESAGSFSVSALMASPLAQGLFQRAIGESGAFFGASLPLKLLGQSEEADVKFALSSFKTASLAILRTKSAADLLLAASKEGPIHFAPNIDGYFLPQSVYAAFASGLQSHIPLLAGWNADEGSYHAIFGKEKATARNFRLKIHALFPDNARDFLKLYPAETDAQAKRSAQDLAGDRFIAYSTWKWLEMQNATGNSPVFRYEFEDAPPAATKSAEERGAYHSAEIEFVFGMLSSKKLPWRPQDHQLSDLMSSYWSNFAKNGNPNGPGLPAWPAYRSEDGYQVLHLKADSQAAPDRYRGRYELLDQQNPYKTKRAPGPEQ
ncbi:MAG TPA: carboxylesterase family protein [Bryobacteraceae bacterium]